MAAKGSDSAHPAKIPCKACIRSFIGKVRAHSAAAYGVAGATGSFWAMQNPLNDTPIANPKRTALAGFT